MEEKKTIQGKLRQLAVILFPILITQLALCAMSFFDTMMSGHASQLDLAGVAIGTNLWMPVFTGINGILIGITPLIAQFHGAKNEQAISRAVIQGLYVAAAMGLTVIVGAIVLLPFVLAAMGLEPAVETIARRFLGGIAFGVMPLFMSTILRSFVDTLGYTRITMMITAGVLPLNILLNYLLIYGEWGFPRLGGAGAGYASAISYWFILLILAVTALKRKPFCHYRIFATWPRPAWRDWQSQLKLGVPIGTSIFFETSIFGVVGVLVAAFGTVTIAAHQAAINFASLVYMLPLSMSMALTILVGFEVGAKREQDARQYAYLGLGAALTLAAFCAIGLWLYNGQVATLYTNDYDVWELTKQFLLYAAFFQLSDAVAAPIQGILRGYKDVNVPFIVAFVSYWVIGLPLGLFLSHFTAFGAFGYWVGFIVGLAFGATALVARLLKLQRKRRQ